MADNKRDNDLPVMEIMTRRDLDLANNFRSKVNSSGGNMGILQISNKALENLNTYLQKFPGVHDTYKTGYTIMITIKGVDWRRLHSADSWQEIKSLLNSHMGKKTAYIEGDLWNFVDTRRTADQIASGIVLQEWSVRTRRAWFSEQKEILTGYRE